MHGLRQGLAACTRRKGTRVEDGGEGVVATAVRAARAFEGVCRGADEADDGPRGASGGGRCHAGFEAAVLDDGSGAACARSGDGGSEAYQSRENQRNTHIDRR